MKATTKIAATALLAAALPLTAQADRATDRAQALNAEPLAQVSACTTRRSAARCGATFFSCATKL